FGELSSARPVGPTNVRGRRARVNGYARPFFCQLAQTTYQAFEIEQVAVVELHRSLLVEDGLELRDRPRANEINIIPETHVWNRRQIAYHFPDVFPVLFDLLEETVGDA